MPAVLAFFASPVGIALVSVVPTIIEDVIRILHQQGKINPQEIVDYIASQIPGDVLVPKKP